jgi:hypothetical protein
VIEIRVFVFFVRPRPVTGRSWTVKGLLRLSQAAVALREKELKSTHPPTLSNNEGVCTTG